MKKEADPKDIELIKTMARTHLKYLCKEILGMKDWSRVHDDLMEFMQRPSKRKLVLVPRNHLKSSIVTKGWGVQQVLNNPNLRVLIANATWDNARRFLGSIQKYLTYGSVLPMYFGTFESDNWNQFDCTIRQRKVVLDAPTFSTAGLEKELTSQHFDTIILDDLVAKENTLTKEQRDKVFQYYLSMFDLLEPEGTIVCVGTRYHQDDLYSKILQEKKEGGTWDVFFRNAYTDETRTQVLFPEKFSLERLNEIRNRPGGKAHFASQYLNNPIDQDSADFRSEWLRTYEPGTAHPASLYLTIDPAISLSRDADFSAMIVAGMYSDRKIRVVDYFRRRVVPSELVDSVFEMVQKWKIHRVGLETFAFQKTLKYDIQNQQRQRGIFFSIDELGKRHGGKGEPQLSKEARIRRLQPLFEQGLIELRKDMQDLTDEILEFPRSAHDDLLDALAWQLDYLVPSMQASQPAASQHGTMGWWLKEHTRNPEGSIYERFMADMGKPNP